MNILLIGSDESALDPGSETHQRLKEYASRIGTLHVLVRARKKQECADGNLIVHGIKAGKVVAPLYLARAARILIRAHDISVVSAQDPFEHGLAAYSALRGSTAKLHLQVHTDYLSPWFSKGAPLNRIRRTIADQLIGRAHRIRVVSARIEASLTKRYGALPTVSVLPIKVPDLAPPSAVMPHPFPFTLVASGRLAPEKRLEDVLEAVARARATYPGVGLLVIGSGPERTKLEHLAIRLKLTEHIVFLGERPDARDLMVSGHAFIQASAYEGYGRSLLEAALARLPIITTNVGIAGDVFEDQEEVLIAPVGNPETLSERIKQLVNDNRLRHVLGANARAKALLHIASLGNLSEKIADDLMATQRA